MPGIACMPQRQGKESSTKMLMLINALIFKMTTGFAGALSRIVSQTQEEDEVRNPNGASDDSCVSSGEEYRAEQWEAINGYSPIPPAARRRKKNRDLAWVPWHYRDSEYLYTEAEVTDALWALALQEFGGRKENGVYWVSGSFRRTSLKTVRTWRCAFYNTGNCGAQCQVTYWKDQNRWEIEVASGAPHNHDIKTDRGLIQEAVLACINSPGKLKQPPKKLVAQASTKLETTLSQAQQVSLGRRCGRLRKQNFTKSLTNGGDGSTYGDVVNHLLNKYKRENIQNFNRDSPFLLGHDVIVNEVIDDKGKKQMRFYCVLSTENLLLNAPRQVQTGQQLILAVDASYRYMVERDHGLFVVKTINHSQEGKTIAYAVCNREDKDALTWIFTAIQLEVEVIVNRLSESGEKYM